MHKGKESKSQFEFNEYMNIAANGNLFTSDTKGYNRPKENSFAESGQSCNGQKENSFSESTQSCNSPKESSFAESGQSCNSPKENSFSESTQSCNSPKENSFSETGQSCNSPKESSFAESGQSCNRPKKNPGFEASQDISASADNPFFQNAAEGKRTNRKKGLFAENTACRYLSSQGFKIIERNFRCKCGEIDIIASKDDCIHFIEVKARSSTCFGYPCEAVDSKKQAKIIRSAYAWIKYKNEISRQMSMDVFEIIFTNGETYIRFLENAFN